MYYDFHGLVGLMAGGVLSYAVSGLALATMSEGRRIMRGVLALRSVLGR